MKSSIRLLPCVAIALAIAASGCHEYRSVVPTVDQPASRSITPRIDVTSSGTSAVITLALDVQGDVGKIGSFTGRLHFDPAGLAYDDEVVLSDGTLRASNPGVGEIRFAGASAAGVEIAALAKFRFTVKNAAALQGVRFDLEEIHELTRADTHASVQRSPAPRLFP